MLICYLNNAKKRAWAKGKGTPHNLVVETAAIIETVYRSFCKYFPEAAEEYKTKLIGLLLDPTSPVWKGE